MYRQNVKGNRRMLVTLRLVRQGFSKIKLLKTKINLNFIAKFISYIGLNELSLDYKSD
jgi:hypothetical protein